MKQSIVLIKGSNREFLEQALGNGLLNGEALRRVTSVLEENDQLRMENAVLRGLEAELRRTIRSYRADHLAALKYQFDAEEGWRYSRSSRWQVLLAACGLSIALTCLVTSLILFA